MNKQNKESVTSKKKTSKIMEKGGTKSEQWLLAD